MPNHNFLDGSDLFSDLTRSEHVEFPVTFDLKVVLEATIPEDSSRDEMKSIFTDLDIPFNETGRRLSSKGNYISFTFNVYIDSREKLHELFDRIRSVPGIRFAI